MFVFILKYTRDSEVERRPVYQKFLPLLPC